MNKQFFLYETLLFCILKYFFFKENRQQKGINSLSEYLYFPLCFHHILQKLNVSTEMELLAS